MSNTGAAEVAKQGRSCCQTPEATLISESRYLCFCYLDIQLVNLHGNPLTRSTVHRNTRAQETTQHHQLPSEEFCFFLSECLVCDIRFSSFEVERSKCLHVKKLFFHLHTADNTFTPVLLLSPCPTYDNTSCLPRWLPSGASCLWQHLPLFAPVICLSTHKTLLLLRLFSRSAADTVKGVPAHVLLSALSYLKWVEKEGGWKICW